MKKINEAAIEMFEKDLFTLQMIGEIYGISRTAVMRYLKRHGVDTSKRKREVVCSNPECGKVILRTKKKARETRRPCCSPECYFKVVNNPDYQMSRQGQRIGRRVIEENAEIGVFEVHHVDGDDYNNEPSNLWAFRTQGEHMRYHRGGKVKAYILTKHSWVEVQNLKYNLDFSL